MEEMQMALLLALGPGLNGLPGGATQKRDDQTSKC
jgi:hypothetical protein